MDIVSRHVGGNARFSCHDSSRQRGQARVYLSGRSHSCPSPVNFSWTTTVQGVVEVLASRLGSPPSHSFRARTQTQFDSNHRQSDSKRRPHFRDRRTSLNVALRPQPKLHILAQTKTTSKPPTARPITRDQRSPDFSPPATPARSSSCPDNRATELPSSLSPGTFFLLILLLQASPAIVTRTAQCCPRTDCVVQ